MNDGRTTTRPRASRPSRHISVDWRIAIVALAGLLLWALLHPAITLPALAVIGILLWATVATGLVIVQTVRLRKASR